MPDTPTSENADRDGGSQSVVPRLSVVIPVHNSSETLAGSVRGAVEASGPNDEIIIADDGSTDGCVAALDPFLLDSVKVKGKKNAVDVITMSDTPFPEEVLNGFDQGKTMFRERKWDEAKACFAAANEASLRLTGKADGPSEMYLERCDDFSETPPPEDWDGSIEMRKK